MRKEPKQARSRKTRQKLMAALETLLREKEFDQITVIEIAATASVSTGLLYSHFRNKADFLEALLEEYKVRVLHRLEDVESNDANEEFRAAGSLRGALRLIAGYAYEQLEEDAHIIRAITQSFRSRANENREEWQELRTRAFRTIAPVLDVYEDELARPNNKQTAEMIVYFYNTIFAQALLLHEQGSGTAHSLGQEVFVREIADFAYGYLTTAPA